MSKICLDAGHGGKDPGAVGNGLKEKDIVLDVGNKVTKILEQHNVEVIHTRTTDVFVELSERAQVANKANADVFVSLHCNAFSNPDAQGVEVFSYPNSVKGKELSQSILDSIVKDNLYTKNRGTKTDNFAVLRLSSMPSALVELGFITNAEDAGILRDKQDELAIAVAKGILNLLDIKYMEEREEPDKLKINLNGVIKTVSYVEKEGNNFIKLQDLRDEKIIIDYDAVNKIPIIRVK